ncbi:MAG: hypothetical protein HRT69_16255 [Flavobacteriaceae bacterium]|nr:hypothetical protein [Flavobacteriaceae bacterium]PHS04379.1 MAG: hypothetical protein COA88_13585 [Kordia sp.]
MKRLFLILTIGLLASCNDALVTDIEKQAVDSVLEYYGGICHRSKGFNSKNGKTTTYFELKMSKSEAIEGQMNKVHLPSSNVAYIFYKNLKEEKKNYNSIHVILTSKDNTEQEFIFPITLLERVEKRMSLANKTITLLKEKQYEQLNSMMNNEIIPFDKEQLIPRLKKIEPEFGNIKEFLFFGFKVVPYKSKNLLHLSGVIIRDKKDHQFSIDIDFDSDKNEIYQLQYKL